MEQIVLLLNPCFPLVSLSGFPPPFHLPAVLVKPGPQRHLLSVTGSRARLGSSPHLPSSARGGRVVFWLLSGRVCAEAPWLLCDLSSGMDSQDGCKSRSRGITTQSQVSAPCTPTQPASANQDQQTSLSFSGTSCSYFPRRHGGVLAPERLGPEGCSSPGRESGAEGELCKD